MKSLHELDELAGGNALKDLPVVITHLKYFADARAAAGADGAGASPPRTTSACASSFPSKEPLALQMNRAALAWSAAGLLAALLLPWYSLQEGLDSAGWLGGLWSSEDYASGHRPGAERTANGGWRRFC